VGGQDIIPKPAAGPVDLGEYIFGNSLDIGRARVESKRRSI